MPPFPHPRGQRLLQRFQVQPGQQPDGINGFAPAAHAELFAQVFQTLGAQHLGHGHQKLAIIAESGAAEIARQDVLRQDPAFCAGIGQPTGNSAKLQRFLDKFGQAVFHGQAGTQFLPTPGRSDST